jgi:hypothetical protein
MADPALTALLSTCSFRGDFEACRMLCDSVDRFVPPQIEHWLIVPARDVDLFRTLASPRRRILAEDGFLPKGFFKLPAAPAWLRRRVGILRRALYLTPFSAPVRGWIVQQIIKIAATERATADIVVHVDSDNAFIRPLTMDHLTRDGKVRLYRDTQRIELDSHLPWHQAAARLLGLPPTGWCGGEYIDGLVIWRRSALAAMTQRIEAISKRPWAITLARTRHFAEYILYGVHADKVQGFEAAGVYPEPRSLCHARWTGVFRDAADEDDFVRSVRPDQVSCLIQSTIALPPELRRRLYARVEHEAARQDADPVSAG